MKTTLLLAAVGNSGQCTQVWSGNLVQVRKVMIIVKPTGIFEVLMSICYKLWLIHVPAAAVIHE